MADIDIPYDPAKIEEKIQSYWNEHETFSVTEDHFRLFVACQNKSLKI